MKKRIIGIALLILTALMLLTAYLLLETDRKLGESKESGGAETAEDSEMLPTEIYAQIPDDQELLLQYQEYNEDVVGLIRIPGTVLNHPIVQTPKDEEYYLMRGLDKQYNPHGVPFLSARSSMEGSGGNRVIYGHNIHKRTRDIFCDLAGYEDLTFYREHPVIETVSKSGTRRWLIWAYFIVDNADTEPFRYSDTLEFLSMASFREYMEQVEERNWLSVPVERSIEDTYLTLSSCSNELAGSGTNRMVVMAVEIPYEQDVDAIVQNSAMTENPKLPEKLSKEQ